jgi:glycosyltransferase involved in cell wall biosynthesis
VNRLAIVSSERPDRIDAIRDHTFLLAEALRKRAIEVDLQLRGPTGHRQRIRGAAERGVVGPLDAYDGLIVQYNPFMWGRWGFAPGLVADVARLRLRRRRPFTVLLVHEPYVPMVSWRWALMGLWQRAQLRALRLGVDRTCASIEAWARALAGTHLPVGSNLPDMRGARGSRRTALNMGSDVVVLATFSSGHPSRLLELVTTSVEAVAARGHKVALLNLGAGAPRITPPGSVVVFQPGELPAQEVASWLAAADVFLAPFVDGVSTRRSSMMAALQHGLAVVGTDGALTDGLLRRSTEAIRLVPVERADLFRAAVVELAGDENARRELGVRARMLYERSFDWAVVAGTLLSLLGEPRNASVRPPS